MNLDVEMSATCHKETDSEFAPAIKNDWVSPTIPSPPYILPNPKQGAEKKESENANN